MPLFGDDEIGPFCPKSSIEFFKILLPAGQRTLLRKPIVSDSELFHVSASMGFCDSICVTMKRSLLLFAFCSSAALLQAASIPFPPALIPFNSIANETAKDSSGNMLVLGYTNPALLPALVSIPFPSSPSEVFSNTLVGLAPAVFFSNVFVPTPAQRVGDFSAFSQPLIDPNTSTAFPRNIIPASLLFGNNGFFAFEVGPSTSATPEPSALSLILGGALALGLFGAIKRRVVTKSIEG